MRSHPMLLAVALAALAGLRLLAPSCSGSSTEGVTQVDSGETTTTTRSNSKGGSGSAAACVACMRRNGFPTYPSPSAKAAEGTPRFGKAKEACARFAPTADDEWTPSARARARQLQRILRYAACMRRNGLPNFPDPRPNPAGYAKLDPDELTDLGVATKSPKYRAAAEACEDVER
jgi:hypothetical protein